MSVIVPTYNLADHLRGAIDSVVAQSYTDWELLVVDDASDDHTEQVVGSYQGDPRIRYLRLESNSGPSAARNAGLNTTSGDLVAFLDADDRWLPEKLERQVAVLQDPSIGVCGVGCYEENPGGRIHRRLKSAPLTGDDLYLELLFTNSLPGSASAIMLRRSCFLQVGQWDEELRGGEDRDLWIRLALHFRFAFVDEPLVRIDRTREDRATRNWHNLAVNRELYLRKREGDVPERFRGHLNALRQQSHFFIARCYFRDGDVANGRRHTVRAILSASHFDLALWRSCELLLKSFIRPADRVLGTPGPPGDL